MPENDLSEQRRRILAAVRANLSPVGLGPKVISEMSGVEHDVVRQLVRKMATDGSLVTDGDGHYYTPSQRSQRSHEQSEP